MNNNIVCSICIDSLLSSAVLGLDCGHVYHQSCIKDWLKMKSNCPMCKVTVRKTKIGKPIYLSTHEAGSSESSGPLDQRVVEENEGLKTKVTKLNESIEEKSREIAQLKEKQNQQNITLQYLKQLKRVAELDADLAKPTSKALFESMRALPREELVCSLASLKSRLKHNKRETDKLVSQLNRSNRIIEEYAQESARKDRELRKYREKYPQEVNDAQLESSKRSKKRKLANNVFARASSTASLNTANLAAINLGDDDDDTDDGLSPFVISEHKRGGNSSSSRHHLPGCPYCRGVPSLPQNIESTRQGKKCIGCDRRLLYPNEDMDEVMMITSSTPTIDVDAENASRNNGACIVLSDDDDSTSDEM